LKIKSNDYVFKVDGNTGTQEIHVPELEEIPYNQILNVHLAALEFVKITGEMLKMSTIEDYKPEIPS
jgi:hypothetical protein